MKPPFRKWGKPLSNHADLSQDRCSGPILVPYVADKVRLHCRDSSSYIQCQPGSSDSRIDEPTEFDFVRIVEPDDCDRSSAEHHYLKPAVWPLQDSVQPMDMVFIGDQFTGTGHCASKRVIPPSEDHLRIAQGCFAQSHLLAQLLDQIANFAVLCMNSLHDLCCFAWRMTVGNAQDIHPIRIVSGANRFNFVDDFKAMMFCHARQNTPGKHAINRGYCA